MARDKEKVKAYNKMQYDKNKKQILEQRKIYRQNNKELFAERRKRPHVIARKKIPKWCEYCHTFIQTTSFSRHKGSKTHLKNEKYYSNINN